MFTYLKRQNFNYSAKFSFCAGVLYIASLALFLFFMSISQILIQNDLVYVQNVLNPADNDKMSLLGAMFVVPAAILFLLATYGGLVVGASGLIFGALGLKSDKRKFAQMGLTMCAAGLLATLVTVATINLL
jgi:hypothetical protein